MARIRTIKPEFFTSEDIVSLTPLARLFYVSLWCESDREGRLVWKLKTLKMRYFPADDCDMQALADELLGAGLVHLYAIDGCEYAYLPGFTKHQIINNREAASVLPEPPFSTQPHVKHDTSGTRESGDTHDAEGKGKEGKGREGKESPSGGTDAPAPVALVINRSGTPAEITETHIASWLTKYPGVDVRNEVRRLMDWTRKHPRPADEDHAAWLESKLAQRYEEQAVKRLAAASGPEADPYDGFDPDEIERLLAVKAAAEARHAR